MPYIIKKTNGTVLTTIPDATLDNTTDLALPGRNYSGYGSPVDDNFVKLLENFSNTTAPSSPIQGQLWFNAATGSLNVNYDGTNWKALPYISVGSTLPTNLHPGDLWWDTTTRQLKTYQGAVIGPVIADVKDAFWIGVQEPATDGNNYSILEGVVNYEPIVVISQVAPFNPTGTDLPLPVCSPHVELGWNLVQSGVTLLGADCKGSTADSGYYFWGTAAEAINLYCGSAGALVYQTGTGYTSFLPLSSNNRTVLQSNGSTAPVWTPNVRVESLCASGSVAGGSLHGCGADVTNVAWSHVTGGGFSSSTGGNILYRNSGGTVSGFGAWDGCTMHVPGNIVASGNVTAYCTSDNQFKKNISDIQGALASVNAIGGKTYDWTDEYIASHGGEDGYFISKNDFGVIAQDVLKAFPLAVKTKKDGTLAVDYKKLVALAFAAIKELTDRVNKLEGK